MFTIEIFQNRHLLAGDQRVHAIVTVSAERSSAVARVSAVAPAKSMVGFVLDKSGSMSGERLVAVTRATIDAIALLDPSTWFFVVAFDASAYLVVGEGPATAARKTEAAQKLLTLRPFGGTAMSVGLMAARALFARRPDALRQAIFLTDGKNESEPRESLERALGACAPVFSCDCWGVGTDWKVGEVQSIAAALFGRASLVADPEGVPGAFRAAVEKASAKALRNVRLRMWTPQGARVAFVKQASPTLEDLGDRGIKASEQVVDYPTGAWAPGESRDFHVAVDVAPGEIGEEILAARCGVLYEAAEGAQGVPGAGAGAAAAGPIWTAHEDRPPEGRIFAAWTDDAALAGRVDERVAHYQTQGELAEAVSRGLALRARGDKMAATQMLGRALELARKTQHMAVTQRLGSLVTVDKNTGALHLEESPSREAEMALELEARATTPPSSRS